MTALTIRRIPFTVEKAIREKAARESLSLSKAVVGMLEDSVTGKKKPQAPCYHDLDWLCGSWNKKQSDDFKKHLDGARKIDPELWQ
jgi:hypothetical protein